MKIKRATSIGWSDPRTAEGELLWPGRFGLPELMKLKRSLGSYGTAGQLQQRPSPLGGGMLKMSWMRRWRPFGPDGIMDLIRSDGSHTIRNPKDGIIFLTVDLATSEKTTADYTVIIVWGLFGQDLVLMALERERVEGFEIATRIKSAMRRHDAAFAAVERQGFQLAVLQQARKKGLAVRELKADRDKVSRALAAAPFIEAGQMFVPESAPWLMDFEEELSTFPNGAHDDQVDALVYGALVAFKYGWIEETEKEIADRNRADTVCSDERDRAPDPMEGFRPAGSPWN